MYPATLEIYELNIELFYSKFDFSYDMHEMADINIQFSLRIVAEENCDCSVLDVNVK